MPKEIVETLLENSNISVDNSARGKIFTTVSPGVTVPGSEHIYFTRRQLEQLESSPTGRALLNNINTYLKSNRKRLNIEFVDNPDTDSYSTRFNSNDPNNLSVIINLKQFQQDRDGYYMDLPEIKSRARAGNQEVFEIAPGRTPLHIALGHELVHFNHFIDAEQKGKSAKKFGESATPKEVSNLKNRNKYPELMIPRIGSSRLFTNAEERKTVIGKGLSPKTRGDGISEMSLRMEAGLNPRYIYQGQRPGSRFFEPADTVRRVIGEDNFRQLRGRLPQYSGSLRPTISAAEQDFFEYTPFSILREIYPYQSKRVETSIGSVPIRPGTPKDQRLHRIVLEKFAPKDLLDQTTYVRGIMRQNKDIAKNAHNAINDQKLHHITGKILKTLGLNDSLMDSAYNLAVGIYNNSSRIFGGTRHQNISIVSTNLDRNTKELITNTLKAKLNRMLLKRFIQYS